MQTYQHNVTCTYDNIIFDLDSTLVTIEGIDELAKIKGVADSIIPITDKAMNGEISLAIAFEERLKIINPTYAELQNLTTIYMDNLVNGVCELITLLHNQDKNVFIVSGGYDPAVTEFAQHLGIPATHVFANRLQFTTKGSYLGLRQDDYLWKEHGKTKIIAEIKQKYPGKTVMIGDGISDFEAAVIADEFICFAGVAQRENVMKKAEKIVYTSTLLDVIPLLGD